MHRSTTLAAALLAGIPQLANAAVPSCLTAVEFASLAQFALPSVITGATQRCAQALPGDAFLRRQGAALASRYGEGRGASWPQAKTAFLKLSANEKDDAAAMIRGMPDEAMQQMLLGMVEGLVGAQLPLERCATVDRVIALLAPLPPRNTAGLIAALGELGMEKDSSGAAGKPRKPGSLSICPA